jgi:hypothetical protein
VRGEREEWRERRGEGKKRERSKRSERRKRV